MNAKRLLILAGGLILAAETATGSGSLNWVFSPLEYLNLTGTYEKYTALIDLFIYVLIFTGSAQVSLGKRFPGTGGRAITAGIGISLSVAMVIAEEKFGFSLKSFGPVAAGVLILLFGIMIYRLVHFAGMARPASAGLAYLAIFLAMFAIAPDLFEGLDDSAPFLSATLAIALLLAFGLSISSLFPGDGARAFRMKLREIRDTYPGRARQQGAIGNEIRFVKRWVQPAAKKNFETSELVLHDLGSVAEAIRKYGHIPQARRAIAERMASIFPKEHELQGNIQNLRTMINKLLELDLSLFSETSRERVEGMSPEEKDLMKKELRDEIQRLEIEKRILAIEKDLDQCIQEICQSLNDAGGELNAGRVEQALQLINRAIDREKAITRLSHEIMKLEYELLALAKRDSRIEKKMNPDEGTGAVS